MTSFLLSRLVYAAVLVVVSSSVAYVLAATQLNPRARYEGRSPRPPITAIDATLSALNMNDKTPLATRFGRWAYGVLRGDLGQTIDAQPINAELNRRMWVSLRLLLIGSVVGTLLGIGAGAFAAVNQHRAFDHTLTATTFVILAMPVVVLAVLVKTAGIGLNEALGFTGETKLLYTTGEITPGLSTWSLQGITNRFAHLLLPSMVLIAVSVAFYGRYQRSAMLDVLSSDFLRMAQAKGLSRRQAMLKHGLRVAVIPMIPLFAFEIALLFVGATFVEQIFGWHGMGEYFVDSVTSHDVNSVAAVSLFVATLVVLAGLASDILYAALDPRLRRN